MVHGIQGIEWVALCLILILALVIYGYFDREHREQQTAEITRRNILMHDIIQSMLHDAGAKLFSITQKLEKMPTKAEFDAEFAKINTATSNIAADITRLADALASGLTAADEDAALAELRTIAGKLETIAAVTPEDTEEPEG